MVDGQEHTLLRDRGWWGGYERRLREMRGSLGDHELVIASTYCGKWRVDENKWVRLKQTYQKHICTNRSGD